MGNTVFDLYKVKINIFLNFSPFLALQKIKEYIRPCHRLEKRFKFLLLLLILVYQPKLSEALRPRKEASLRHKILELGSQQQFGTT